MSHQKYTHICSAFSSVEVLLGALHRRFQMFDFFNLFSAAEHSISSKCDTPDLLRRLPLISTQLRKQNSAGRTKPHYSYTLYEAGRWNNGPLAYCTQGCCRYQCWYNTETAIFTNYSRVKCVNMTNCLSYRCCTALNI